MAQTQRHLADRALQLLQLPAGVPALLLDCGCGTGYSGRALERGGNTWFGVDLSEHMLRAARTARPKHSHLIAADIGQGLGFRKGIFDGAISISAVQWLCHATRPGHDPEKRVRKFFAGLYAVLAGGARAVLQFYPEDPRHVDMLREAAMNAGFAGGLVVDYPWSERSKKLFLVLIKAKQTPSANEITSHTATHKPQGTRRNHSMSNNSRTKNDDGSLGRHERRKFSSSKFSQRKPSSAISKHSNHSKMRKRV